MMKDLCLHFPEVRACFDRVDGMIVSRKNKCRFLPSQFSFPATCLSEEEYGDLERQFWEVDSGLQSILAANFAAEEMLRKIAVRPDMYLGHSAGEYSAWIASGTVSEEALLQKQEALSALYRDDEAKVPTAMLVLATNRAKVEQLLSETEGEVYVSNDNCPHQVVVVGRAETIGPLSEAAKAKGIMAESLPSTMAHPHPRFQHPTPRR